MLMTDRKKPAEHDARTDKDMLADLDPETAAFLKDYLAISDDDLKAHVRRLVEEIRLNPKRKKPKE